MLLKELPLRDICVLPDPVSKQYFMIGPIRHPGIPTSMDILCFKSADLLNWEFCSLALKNRTDFDYDQCWAPEIHSYNGSYYFFGTLRLDRPGEMRGCYILKSDRPEGPYRRHSGLITPKEWECIDGTLYVDEDGTPYMVYVREWIRCPEKNGQMYAVALKKDLSGPEDGADHVYLFSARDSKAVDFGVTDGPWLYRAADGSLVMIWSNSVHGEYGILKAVSATGSVSGPWIHDEKALWAEDDGGHAMIFRDFDGNTRIAFHIHNHRKGRETEPVIYYLNDRGGDLSITRSPDPA